MPESNAIARRLHVARILSASLAVMLLVACRKAPPSAPPPPPAVSVAEVVARDITEWDEYTGRLEAKDTVEIRPQVSGVLQRVAFIEGKEVKKGDLLFQLDPRPFQAELDRAQAEAERARTAADLAAAELARAEKLSSSNVISKELYEQRAAASRSAAAAVRGAQAALETARLNLAYTRIASPISGRIGRAEVTPGNLVNGEGGSATLLATVVSMQPMYAYFEAAEQDYLKYMDLARSGARPLSRDVKNPVFMSVGNESDFSHQGYMDFVDNRVRAGTGTLQGRAVFPNPDRHLTPGMFVRVRLIGSGKYRGLLINDRAIATDQDRRYVLVVGEGDKLEYRALTTGPVVDGLRVVREGLKAGDRIVVNGLQRVRPGMQVTPKLVPMEEQVTASPAPAAAQ
ncbi:MAG TPA: efflux RND transporter periplasmic adaptor subunit [Steroidobacteraceae bacterium]|nr:efflux RND transporter periplasmic adaptor subunit [Steroidobacteraceae bacterium]